MLVYGRLVLAVCVCAALPRSPGCVGRGHAASPPWAHSSPHCHWESCTGKICLRSRFCVRAGEFSALQGSLQKERDSDRVPFVGDI